MGLDLVELTIGIEEAFDVSIPDDKATLLETPRLVIEYLESLLIPDAGTGCISQQAFYFIRDKLMKQLSLPRSHFRPEEKWENILSKQNRRSQWVEFWHEVGVSRFPSLHRPRPLAFALFTSVIGLFALLWHFGQHFPLSGFVSLLIASGFGWLVILATRRYSTIIPAEVSTFGQTAQFLAVHAPATIKGPQRSWTKKEIQATVVQLIQYHLGIEEFSLDDHFVRDLGAD
jgi:acyl carrier protein